MILIFQIEIPVAKVVNISREKTAFFIPNAIGIRTQADKVWQTNLIHIIVMKSEICKVLDIVCSMYLGP